MQKIILLVCAHVRRVHFQRLLIPQRLLRPHCKLDGVLSLNSRSSIWQQQYLGTFPSLVSVLLPVYEGCILSSRWEFATVLSSCTPVSWILGERKPGQTPPSPTLLYFLFPAFLWIVVRQHSSHLDFLLLTLLTLTTNTGTSIQSARIEIVVMDTGHWCSNSCKRTSRGNITSLGLLASLAA